MIELIKNILDGTLTKKNLIALIGHEEIAVRKAILKSPFIDSDILLLMADDKSVLIRVLIVKHKKVNIEILDFMSKDKSIMVKREIVYNPITSSSILSFLSSDSSVDVLTGIAMHSNADIFILDQLSYKFPYFVIKNKNVNNFLIEQILDFCFADLSNERILVMMKILIIKSVLENKKASVENIEKAYELFKIYKMNFCSSFVAKNIFIKNKKTPAWILQEI